MRAHCVLIIWFTRMPSKHQRIHFNIISKRLCALEHIFVSMISPLLHKCMNVCKMSTRVISTIIDDFNGRLWRMALQSICIGLMLFSTYASIIAQSHPEQSTSIASKINIIFHRIFAGESVRKKISERRRGKKHRVRSVCVCRCKMKIVLSLLESMLQLRSFFSSKCIIRKNNGYYRTC